MDDHIYRVDRINALRRIDDGHFRAKKWPNGQHDYPHRVLKAATAGCPPGQSVFRICFWPTLQRAETSLSSDFSHWGDGVISRLSKSELQVQGFAETWDDGFNEGEAYLFWKYDSPTEISGSLSASGIPVGQVEILKNGQWLPFKSHTDQSPAKNSPEPAEASEYEMKASTHNPVDSPNRSPMARLRALFWPE
jgi:hypothetical protein